MRWFPVLLMLFSADLAAQRIGASLDCKSAGTDFVYDCTLRLARAGQPLSGARVTVGADMPSMPMAHTVRPVKAKPTKTPGEYRVRLDLEMLGEWEVKLRLSGPVRDQLVLRYDFTETGTVPRR